jgi:hypothetical protein
MISACLDRLQWLAVHGAVFRKGRAILCPGENCFKYEARIERRERLAHVMARCFSALD